MDDVHLWSGVPAIIAEWPTVNSVRFSCDEKIDKKASLTKCAVPRGWHCAQPMCPTAGKWRASNSEGKNNCLVIPGFLCLSVLTSPVYRTLIPCVNLRTQKQEGYAKKARGSTASLADRKLADFGQK